MSNETNKSKKRNVGSEIKTADKSEIRKYTYHVKGKIREFIEKYVQILINIKKEKKVDYNMDIHLKSADNFKKIANDELMIRDIETCDKLLASIGISEILLEQCAKYNDIEGILNSFYRLEDDLNLLGVLKLEYSVKL